MDNKEIFHAKHSITKAKYGSYQIKNGTLIRNFGCLKCSWSGTEMCPNKVMRGGHCMNWICGVRIRYLQSELKKCGSLPRVIQQEELFKLSMVSDWLLNEWFESGELSEEFKHISKNIIILTDKMRRQNEGIKVQQEINVEVSDFRKVIDAQSKIVKDKDIIKEADILEAEVIEDVSQSDNGTGQDKPREEIQFVQ